MEKTNKFVFKMFRTNSHDILAERVETYINQHKWVSASVGNLVVDTNGYYTIFVYGYQIIDEKKLNL